jgi:hypothetical protein
MCSIFPGIILYTNWTCQGYDGASLSFNYTEIHHMKHKKYFTHQAILFEGQHSCVQKK